MISYPQAQLRKHSPVPSARVYTCDRVEATWQGCGREYHTLTGIEPFCCPECRRRPEIKQWVKDRQRARRLKREGKTGAL